MEKLMIYTGKMITAQDALNIGLVEKVVPHEMLMSEAKAMASTYVLLVLRRCVWLKPQLITEWT